jgi:NAD(P)H-binding
MEFHEVGHARRRLAGEPEVVRAHPVIASLLVELGHHREVVDDVLRQARRPKLFAPLGSRRVAIADRPAERLGEDARIVVQVGRFRPGQIVDVTDVRRRVVEDRRDGARNVDRRDGRGLAGAGAIAAIGCNLTAMLLAKGHKVRALVRREDERASALRRLGAEVVQGDLTDLASMHRAIEDCARIYFGMSVSAAYLEATVNTAAVARHHGVEAFVNMSQMTVTQMSITETTHSPQHKLHWLAEQALSWSGLPVVTVRPTVFLEGFFLLLAAASVRDADELALPMGGSGHEDRAVVCGFHHHVAGLKLRSGVDFLPAKREAHPEAIAAAAPAAM